MADDIILQDWLGGTEWLSIVLAALASFFIGFLWYTPLFGKAWAREMQMDADVKPDGKVMAKGLSLSIVGQFLTAFVLWHVIMVFVPTLWGETLGAGDVTNAPAWSYAFWGGLFVWLGFFVPAQMTRMAWEGASIKLALINASHDLVRLQAMAFILSYMGPI